MSERILLLKNNTTVQFYSFTNSMLREMLTQQLGCVMEVHIGIETLRSHLYRIFIMFADAYASKKHFIQFTSHQMKLD